MSTQPPIIERWIWLIGSIGIAVLTAGVHWAVAERRSRHGEAPKHQLEENPWLVQPLRLIYAVGIPAAALLWRGALTPSGLGLQVLSGNLPDWVRDLGWAAILGAGTWAVIVWGEALAHRQVSPDQTLTTRHPVGSALIEAVYHQVHWAFYREPFVLLWGIGLGAWLGLLPVLAEAAFNPQRWLDLQHTAAGRNLLIRAALAVLSAVIYLQTQNLWVALAADAVLGIALGQLVPVVVASSSAAPDHELG